MYVELKEPTNARLFSFVNNNGEIEMVVQEWPGARHLWHGIMSGTEALQLAQQIEDAALVALDNPSPDVIRASRAATTASRVTDEP